jgi:hypothetical protein
MPQNMVYIYIDNIKGDNFVEYPSSLVLSITDNVLLANQRIVEDL